MPTNSYDVIVLGDDFPGLVAGTLCASRGMRVLIVHSDHPVGYTIGPHKLPVEPLVMAGMGSPAIRRVLGELHFEHPLKRKLRTNPLAYQFVAPNARIDVATDEQRLMAELSRELADPEAAAHTFQMASAVAEHLDPVLGQDIAFPPDGFWERREVSRGATRIEDEAKAWRDEIDEPLTRALVGLPAALTGGYDPMSLSAEGTARSLHTFRDGAPRVDGDWESLRELFLEKLANHSGETRTARAAELTFSWGKVNGVKLENGEELGAGHVIAAMPLDALLPMTEKKRPKRLAQCVEALEPAGYRYTLNLVVDEAGVPEGMTSSVFLVGDPEAPLIGDNAVGIYLSQPDDEARVVVSVTAICPIPAPGDSLDDAFADLRVRLRERIDMVMPFFSEHVLLAHSPQEAAEPEGTRHSLSKHLPVPPTVVWRSSLNAALGVSAVPYSIGVKRLTIASRQVLPHLGLEGDFAVGWCAAKIASGGAGKKKDYLKDEVLAG